MLKLKDAMDKLNNGESQENKRQEKIIQYIMLGARLTFAIIMFAVLSYMPFVELTQYSLEMGYVSEQTQMIVSADSLISDEKKTVITLKDTLNGTEQNVSMEVGEVLDERYIKYSTDIKNKNYILLYGGRYYKFNGFWSQEPQSNAIDGHCGEQYINKNGECIRAYWKDGVTILYAHWAIVCKINFYLPSGDSYEEKPAFAKYPYVGKTLIESDEWITEEDKQGHNLSQMLWYENQSNTISANQNFVAPDVKLVRLYGKAVAESERVKYTVTLTVDDDANIPQGTKQPKAWNYNDKICTQEYTYAKASEADTVGELPTPTKTGYKFLHWIDTSTEEKVDDKTPVIKDIFCKPLWETKEYNVKLIVNGEDDKEITLIYGETQVDKIEIPATKEHYIFDGYYSENGQQYFDSEGNNIKKWDIDKESPTLTAKYTPIEYKITYELNGGTLSESNPTQYNIEDNTITLIAPTKEGHVFVGWKTFANSVPQKIVTIPQGSYGDRTYIAVFELIRQEEETLTITIKCTNYTTQNIFVYLYDENRNLVASLSMENSTYTFVPSANSSKYYIQIKTTIPNKLTFIDIPADYTQTTLGSTTTLILAPTEQQNYIISFSVTNAQITNTITI